MAVSGLQSARVFPGRFVKSKVPVGGGHLGFQATRQGMRPWRRSLQTVNAKEEEKVDVKDEASASKPVSKIPVEPTPVEDTMGDAAPKEGPPAEAAPVETASIDPVPVVEASSVDAAPADPVPVVDTAPVNTTPVGAVPVDADLPNLTPVKDAMVDAAPKEGPPAEAAPVRTASTDPVPVVEVSSVDTAPADPVPVVDAAPVDTTPADAAPADTTPADTAPPNPIPLKGAMADVAPADPVPMVDAAPVDTTPPDTTPPDTAPPDTAPPDTAPPSRTPVKDSVADAAPADPVPMVDAAPPDTTPPDTASPDTAPPSCTPVKDAVADAALADPVPMVDAAPVDTTSPDTAPPNPIPVKAAMADAAPADPVPVEDAAPVKDAPTEAAQLEDDSVASSESEERMIITDFKNEGPEPRKFQMAEGQAGDILPAALGLLMRLGTGAVVEGYQAKVGKAQDGTYTLAKLAGLQVLEWSDAIKSFKRPAQPVMIYEYEACPFCRKVREAVSILDLDVIFYPCPSNGLSFRPKAIELGGKRSFPYMVDPNTGKSMYESDDIIKYLFKEYGGGEVPLALRLGLLTTLTCGLAMLGRIGKGGKYRAAIMPKEPLIYWGYEGSPFCKVVREALCELELPHLQKSAARGSLKRQELYDIEEHFQVPYLQDPNTGVALFESSAIIEYLEKTYAA